MLKRKGGCFEYTRSRIYQCAGPGGRYIQMASMIRELIGKISRQASRVCSSLDFSVAKGIKVWRSELSVRSSLRWTLALIAASKSQERIPPTCSAFVRDSHETGGSENFLADARPRDMAKGAFGSKLPPDQNLFDLCAFSVALFIISGYYCGSVKSVIKLIV